MTRASLLALILVAGLQAWVRLAPSDPAVWHVDLAGARPAALVPSPSAKVTVLTNAAFVDLAGGDAAARLAQVAAAAARTPRTRILAGSVAEGHVTWITRSLLWGFPDYTTAQITPSGLTFYARSRFGKGDLGVNAARLQAWLGPL